MQGMSLKRPTLWPQDGPFEAFLCGWAFETTRFGLEMALLEVLDPLNWAAAWRSKCDFTFAAASC